MPGFTLRTEDEAIVFQARFFEKPPTIVEGGPTLARVPRPKQKSLTEWTNHEPFAVEVSYKFHDEEGRGLWVEQELAKLERLQGIAQEDEPHEVILLGDPPGCVPHDFHDNKRWRWWVESVSEDSDKVERNDAGNRTFVTGIIKLAEVVEDEKLAKLKPKKKPKKQQKRYTVKKGDTLAKIATRRKIKGGWKTLAKLNKIRDPKKLRVGQKIRLH